MRYFLDTNILIFHALGGEGLEKDVKAIFDDYENLIYVSSEVVKEVMHLIRYKKINVEQWKEPSDIWKFIEKWRFNIDYVKQEHIKTLGNLTMAKDHKDPADHIIISQAIANKMPLISSDQQFRHYKKQGLSLVFNNVRGKINFYVTSIYDRYPQNSIWLPHGRPCPANYAAPPPTTPWATTII